MVMVAWGDKWLAGKPGPPVLYRHHACGEISRVDLRRTHCGARSQLADRCRRPSPNPMALADPDAVLASPVLVGQSRIGDIRPENVDLVRLVTLDVEGPVGRRGDGP